MTFVLPDRKRMKGLLAVGNTEREFIPSINKHALPNIFYFSCLISRFLIVTKRCLHTFKHN